MDAGEIGMGVRVQGIGEQPQDVIAAEPVGGQADGVDDDQLGCYTVGAGVTVGGQDGECGTHNQAPPAKREIKSRSQPKTKSLADDSARLLIDSAT